MFKLSRCSLETLLRFWNTLLFGSNKKVRTFEKFRELFLHKFCSHAVGSYFLENGVFCGRFSVLRHFFCFFFKFNFYTKFYIVFIENFSTRLENWFKLSKFRSHNCSELSSLFDNNDKQFSPNKMLNEFENQIMILASKLVSDQNLIWSVFSCSSRIWF